VLNPTSCHTPDRIVFQDSEQELTKRRFCTFRPFDSFYWDQLALHTEMFAFLGQLMGMAIRNHLCLPLDLDPIVWKILVKEKLCREDLRSIDNVTYERLRRIERGEEVDEEDEKLRWNVPLSNGVKIELLSSNHQDRRDVIVEEKDRHRFVELAFQERLRESEIAAKAIRLGLVSVIPERALMVCTWKELQQLVCGDAEIDLDLLREMTEYEDGVTKDSPHVKIFWKVLESFDNKDRAAFLRFVWGRVRIPKRRSEFKQKFKIQSASEDETGSNNSSSAVDLDKEDQKLPKAHTCFFSLSLPRYRSEKIMRERLLYAIHNCVEMYADFRLSESEMQGVFV